MPNTYIYARTSLDSQVHDGQTHQLLARFPDAQVVTEIGSGGKELKHRPMLTALIKQLKAGDRLAVAALDRLSRRTTDCLLLLQELEQRGVIFYSAREAIDYSHPVGKLVTSIIASVAEMEREMIRERSRQGIAAARANGKQIGRPRSISDITLARGVSLVVEKGYSISQASKEVRISYPYLSVAVRAARMKGAGQAEENVGV